VIKLTSIDPSSGNVKGDIYISPSHIIAMYKGLGTTYTQLTMGPVVSCVQELPEDILALFPKEVPRV